MNNEKSEMVQEQKKDWSHEFMIEWTSDHWSCDGQSFAILGSHYTERSNILRKADGRKIFWNPFYVPGKFDHNKFSKTDERPKILAYHMERMKTFMKHQKDPQVIERIQHNMSVIEEIGKELP